MLAQAQNSSGSLPTIKKRLVLNSCQGSTHRSASRINSSGMPRRKCPIAPQSFASSEGRGKSQGLILCRSLQVKVLGIRLFIIPKDYRQHIDLGVKGRSHDQSRPSIASPYPSPLHLAKLRIHSLPHYASDRAIWRESHDHTRNMASLGMGHPASCQVHARATRMGCIRIQLPLPGFCISPFQLTPK